MTNEMIERCARAIARANGDEFSNAFKNKGRWIAKRGMSGGRFRDANEPFQSDYLDMARAVLKELMTPTDEMVEAGSLADDDCHVGTPYGPGRKFNAPELIWKAMLTEALEENP